MASRGHVPELRGAGQAGLFGLRAIGRPSGLAFPGHRGEYRRRGARLDTGFPPQTRMPTGPQGPWASELQVGVDPTRRADEPRASQLRFLCHSR